ncbi:WD repeat-containing protein JIP5 [Ceratocystis lukuohia]|uniref:WD repeat-containing protein JIP5 n=2 Tax=Ceratocystis TaxID=5157 RepID=A0A0F8B3I4_CERFI|nr:WD repeat-containing protein JIP5 [Ceratocystis platani]
MFESTCSLPTSSDLFCLVLHPEKPLLTVGLASGHVETFELPAPASETSTSSESTSQKPKKIALIRSVWRTKRHQGSCRALAYQKDGSRLFSAGTDGLIKGFAPETGRVSVKLALGPSDTGIKDDPSMLLVLNPSTIIASLDSAWVRQFDLENPEKSLGSLQPHEDFVTGMISLPPSKTSTSGVSKQWASTGQMTVSISDMHKGVVDESGEQDEMLICISYIPNMRARKASKTTGILVTGSDNGILKTWDPSDLEKPVHKIKVKEGESLECMVPLPESLGMGDKVACGFGDGIIRVVDLRTRKVVEDMTMSHDALSGEPVIALAVDCYGRLISGGGQIVKVWEDLADLQGNSDDEEDEEEEEEEEDNSDDDNDGEEEEDVEDEVKTTLNHKAKGKRSREESSDSDADGDEDEDEDDESEDDSDDDDGEHARRLEQKEAAKKRKLGPMGAHGILKFDGLD